jgi:hypothetical protein
MKKQLVQLNFQFNLPDQEYQTLTANLAESFANVPGLVWKIWLISTENKEAGGIYLFEDIHAVLNFQASDLYNAVATHPALTAFSVKSFEILDEPGLLTHAPTEGKAAIGSV